MGDTYTIMRVFAGSWGLLFMFTVFVLVILFVLRPGSGRIYKDTANIPFRHDDKPARTMQTGAEDAQTTEARQ
jgi:cytochrome c oxidase cbb3-type subunit 4|tara:strand:- start:222 stop:440 length:219 start_codon:yes stop_codon:yes gene_type:complete